MTNASPAVLLDTLLSRYGLKNDAVLSRKLGVAPPVVSKLRAGKLGLGAAMILNIHETFDMAVAQIRELGGVPRRVVADVAAKA